MNHLEYFMMLSRTKKNKSKGRGSTLEEWIYAVRNATRSCY